MGPVVTVLVNAASHLLSALGIRAIGGTEAPPARGGEAARWRRADLLDGWRRILGEPSLRPLFLNAVLVNGLIMATAPLIAVPMLGRLGFAPWQYGLAFGAPGAGGLALVMAAQLGLVISVGIFTPVLATHRLRQTPADRVVRTLSAWSVTSSATVAAMTVLWGVLGALAGPRAAIAVAGVLMLATLLLLLRAPALSPRRAAAARRRPCPPASARGPAARRA